MTDRTIDYHCKRCGEYIFSHHDGPFTEDPPKERICKKCEDQLRFGIGKRKFLRRKRT